MSRNVLPVFDTTLQKTTEWLRRLMEEPAIPADPQAAYQALRAVLHALRDRITVEEAVQLGAQMPMLVRGICFEGWKAADSPRKERHLDEFLRLVQLRLDGGEVAKLDPRPTVSAVFRLLSERISAGEVEDVRSMLPAEVQELWPR